MSTGRDQPATPAAHPVDLAGAWNASDADVGDRLHPLYGPALARLPDGPAVFRGLPFALGSRAVRPALDPGRSRAGDRPRTTPPREPSRHRAFRGQLARRERRSPARDAGRLGLPDRRAARPLRDRARRRPDDRARRPAPVRGRRRDHRLGVPAVRGDRAPHSTRRSTGAARIRARSRGRYAPAGHGGALTVLPGSWGASQTGVADAVPSPDDDVTYWLHAVALPPDAVPVRLHLTPLGDGRPGTSVVIAGLTLFDGTADPLVLSGRRQVLVEGTGGAAPEVDLGMVIQSRPAALTPAGRTARRRTDRLGVSASPAPPTRPEAEPMGRRSSSTSPWRPTRRSRSAAGGSPRRTWSPPFGIRAARSRSCRWPRPTSGSRSGSRRTARWPRPGSGSWPPTAATCHRSATARRSTRPRSRTPEPA